MFGPNFPVEKSGHHDTRANLFQTAAYYALSDEEEEECFSHAGFTDILFFLMMSAKQLRYGWLNEARLHFAEHVFTTSTRASKEIQGTDETLLNFILLLVYSVI